MEPVSREEQQARREGAEAARRGRARSDNPYFVHALRQAWLAAYDGVLASSRRDARIDSCQAAIDDLRRRADSMES